MARECEKISKFSGEIEIDESYFGAKRVRGLVLSFTSFATASRRGYAKHRLSKFKGIKKENFLLHLRECKFRYNTKTTQENLYQKLLKLIRENPIKFN